MMQWRQQTLQVQRLFMDGSNQLKLQSALFTIHRYQHSGIMMHYTKLLHISFILVYCNAA